MKYKMKTPYMLLFYLTIYGCHSGRYLYVEPDIVSHEYVKQETLIKVFARTSTGGEMCFLTSKDDKCEYWEFSYVVDLKYKEAYCRLINKEIYEIGDKSIPYKKWETATGLEHNFKRDWKVSKYLGKRYGNRYNYINKCFNCLADSFLQLSNDEKLDILKKYSQNQEWYLDQLSIENITWKKKKFLENICLDDACQILDWCNSQLPFAVPSMAEYNVKGKRLIVLVVAGFSGIVRSGIYIFKQEHNQWFLVAEGKIINTIPCQFTSGIDSDEQKILIKQWDRFTKFNYEEREFPCNDNSQEKRKITISSVNWSNAEPIIVGGLNIDDL